jgi:hypothetical protein
MVRRPRPRRPRPRPRRRPRRPGRPLVLTGIAWALASACTSEGVLDPPALVPVSSEVRSAPQEIALADVTVRLESYLWRDFQPIATPDGKPLTAVLRIKTIDGAPIPASLQADTAWVLNGDLAWAAAVREEWPRGAASSFFEVVARGGPKWGPGIEVDVVVRLRDEAGQYVLLQARAQLIQRTD